MLEQGRATLFRKPSDQEADGLVSPKPIITQFRIQASFILKGKEVWLVVANFLTLESFDLAAALRGLVTMLPESSNKTHAILSSPTFYLWINVMARKILDI